MKKIIAFLWVFFVFLLICPCASAQENEQEDFSQIKEEIENTIRNSVDDDTGNILESQGITVENPESVTKIKPENVFSQIWEFFLENLKKPIVMLGKIIATALLAICIKTMCTTSNQMVKFFDVICTLTVITVISDSLGDSFETIKKSLENIQTFMTAYIPVFAGTASAVGNTVLSGTYGSVTLLVCEIVSILSEIILIPFLSVVLAFNLVTAINPRFNLSDCANSINKFVVWTLSAVTSVFGLLLSVQGAAGSAVDGKAAKIIKFASSSFIPVIGSQISETYSAVRGSLGLIKTAVGVVGVAVIFIIVIRPVISILAIKFCLWLGRIVMEIFSQNHTANFIKNVNGVLSVGLAIVICCGIVFIIATAVTMMAAIPGG